MTVKAYKHETGVDVNVLLESVDRVEAVVGGGAVVGVGAYRIVLAESFERVKFDVEAAPGPRIRPAEIVPLPENSTGEQGEKPAAT